MALCGVCVFFHSSHIIAEIQRLVEEHPVELCATVLHLRWNSSSRAREQKCYTETAKLQSYVWPSGKLKKIEQVEELKFSLHNSYREQWRPLIITLVSRLARIPIHNSCRAHTSHVTSNPKLKSTFCFDFLKDLV